MNNNMREEYKIKELADRWISLLRMKAQYEHNARKNGEVAASEGLQRYLQRG